jgi:hypothetical protein
LLFMFSSRIVSPALNLSSSCNLIADMLCLEMAVVLGCVAEACYVGFSFSYMDMKRTQTQGQYLIIIIFIPLPTDILSTSDIISKL